MLLVVDSGNTNVVFAVYDEDKLLGSWRAATNPKRTADEYAVWLTQLFGLAGVGRDDIDATIIANVVPENYILNVWHQRGKPEKETDYPRAITISPDTSSLGTIRMVDAGELLANHKNKYGHDYEPPANPIYK